MMMQVLEDSLHHAAVALSSEQREKLTSPRFGARRKHRLRNSWESLILCIVLVVMLGCAAGVIAGAVVLSSQGIEVWSQFQRHFPQ